MSSAVIAALATAIPAICAAIAGLIVAIKSNGTANTANQNVTSHIMTPHNNVGARVSPIETGDPVMSENPEVVSVDQPDEVAPEVAPEEAPNPLAPMPSPDQDGLALMGLRAPVVDAPLAEPVPGPVAPEGAPVPVAPPAGVPSPTQKDAVLAALDTLVNAIKNL